MGNKVIVKGLFRKVICVDDWVSSLEKGKVYDDDEMY